jgi:adenylate cyclase
MPDVCILPDQRVVTCVDEEPILEAALRARIPFAHACGGRGSCSTCRVLVVDGWRACTGRTPKEWAIAERLGFTDEFRLACQTGVTAQAIVRRLVLDSEDIALADQRRRRARRVALRRPMRVDSRTPEHGRLRAIGEELPVAVLFADIRGFTVFSEALLPYDVIHELQRHLHEVNRAVEHHSGVVTSYMGDGVMALFTPRDGLSPSLRAARAGTEMLAHADRRRGVLEELYGRAFVLNVGMHAGPAIVGMLWGSPPTLTAIGGTVNLAARVEQANKELGTRFLTTEETTTELRERVEFGRCFRRSLAGVGERTLVEILDAH